MSQEGFDNIDRTVMMPEPRRDRDAELAVLGAIFLKNEVYDDVSSILCADDFYYATNQTIYEMIDSLAKKNSAIDTVTVYDKLMRTGRISDVDIEYLASVAESVPTVVGARDYANIIKKCSTQRKLLQALYGSLVALQRTDTDVSTLVENAQQALSVVSESNLNMPESVADALPGYMDRFIQKAERGATLAGISTGLEDLDCALKGLQKKKLYIVAGRPSMGKTAFAGSIALNVAIGESKRESQKTVAFFSLEMGKDELLDRLLSSLSGINGENINIANLKNSQDDDFYLAADTLSGITMHIDDAPAQTLSQIRTKVRTLKRKHGLALVVVDYLQLMGVDNNKLSKNEAVGANSTGLKNLAKEFDVPVILLSQLNRGVESRTNKRPMMSDLRDSGQIEQDADVIVMVYRDEYYNPQTEDVGVIESIISKNRGGSVGTVKLSFIKELTKVTGLDYYL